MVSYMDTAAEKRNPRYHLQWVRSCFATSKTYGILIGTEIRLAAAPE